MTPTRQQTDAAADRGPDMSRLLLQRYGEEAQAQLVETVELRAQIEHLSAQGAAHAERAARVSAELAGAKAQLDQAVRKRDALTAELRKALPHLPKRQAQRAAKLLPAPK